MWHGEKSVYHCARLGFGATHPHINSKRGEKSRQNDKAERDAGALAANWPWDPKEGKEGGGRMVQGVALGESKGIVARAIGAWEAL